MRILSSPNPKNGLAAAFRNAAQPVIEVKTRGDALEALDRLDPKERCLVFHVADLRGLPLDFLEPFRARLHCRVVLGSSSVVEHGAEYVRWLRAGALDVLVPGMESTLRQRMLWAIDDLEEPDPGTVLGIPHSGSVYLLTPYRMPHNDVMEKWIVPALQYAGYQSDFASNIHDREIRQAENHLADRCCFAVAHLGNDRADGVHNTRVHSEIRTLVNNGKLVIGIRHIKDKDVHLPGDSYAINCHHFEENCDVAKWLYKILVKAKSDAAGTTSASGRR